VTSFGDFRDPNRFQVNQALTSDPLTLQNAVNSLKAELGENEPEDWINALFQFSTGAVTFRDGSSRIIILVNDAPNHEPSNGHTLDGNTIVALKGKTIRVIGINVGVKHFNQLGQAIKISAMIHAQGGVVFQMR
jgi:hypothetical protein